MAEPTETPAAAPAAASTPAAPAAASPAPAAAATSPAPAAASPPAGAASPLPDAGEASGTAAGGAVAEGQADIEVDAAVADETDADSAIDSQLSAYTASLSSSVLDFPVEHGRRYHAFRGGSYIMPNDEQEIQRLDLMHMLLGKTLHGRLFLTPIDESAPLRILDCATGTGIWAIEVGDMLPNAEILGNDLSPIQPMWLPPNVKFEVDDIESPWLHERPFDFIFMRYMTSCINDWPKLVDNMYNALNPGGFCELQDFHLEYYSEDGSLKPEHKTYIWIHTFIEAAKKMGRPPNPGPDLHTYLKDAGFKNVHTSRYKLPLGPWPKDPHLKDIGLCNLAQALDGLEAFSLRLFCDFLKWSEEEVLVLTAGVRKELKSGLIHCMFDFHVAYGQK